MTLIQRFGSALNLNIHFHMLVLDGAYLVGTEPPVFRRNAPPGEAELQALVECLAERIGRALERQGVLVRDAESSFLELEPAADGPMADLLGHWITSGSSMLAITFSLPPQRAHCSISMPNTRFSRRAHVSATCLGVGRSAAVSRLCAPAPRPADLEIKRYLFT